MLKFYKSENNWLYKHLFSKNILTDPKHSKEGVKNGTESVIGFCDLVIIIKIVFLVGKSTLYQ